MEMQRKVQQRVNTINGYDILSERTETEEYVLCNWGWSGMYDGYYLNGIFDMTGDEYILEEPNPIQAQARSISLQAEDYQTHISN